MLSMIGVRAKRDPSDIELDREADFLEIISKMQDAATEWRRQRKAAAWTTFSLVLLTLNSIVQQIFPSYLAPISHIGLGILIGTTMQTNPYRNASKRKLWRRYAYIFLRQAMSRSAPESASDVKVSMHIAAAIALGESRNPMAHLQKIAEILPNASRPMRELLVAYVLMIGHAIKPRWYDPILSKLRRRQKA